MSSGLKKKEPRYLCLSEARASHSHRTCTEVSSSVPHFLQVGSLLSPITCRCLFRVLCPVSRPVTTLGCVLLKDNSWAPIANWGPRLTLEHASVYNRAYATVPDVGFLSKPFTFLLIFCLETPKKGSGTTNRCPEPILTSLSAISFPFTTG
jgi:hypothetical protein